MKRRRNEVRGVPSDYGLRVGRTRSPDGGEGLLSILAVEMSDGSTAWVVESSNFVMTGHVLDEVISDEASLTALVDSLGPEWLPDTLETLELHEKHFRGRLRYRRA